jgi:hypothetical protein
MRAAALACAVLAVLPAEAPAMQGREAEIARTMAERREAHIAAHAPPRDTFEALLQQDLNAYFRKEEGIADAAVTFQLLRRRAAQTGVSLPKYYLWVEAASNGVPEASGAVIVAAVDQRRFDVLNFTRDEQIRRSPESLAQYPESLAPAIRERAARKP